MTGVVCSSTARLFHRFILGSFAGVLVTLCSIIAVSYLVDPYHLFGQGDIRLKPKVHHQLRLHKAYQVRKIKPANLILGSSRAYHGLNPDHPALSRDGAAYNLGVPAGRIAEVRAFLEHANKINKLRHAVIGLDFFAFDPLQTSQNGMPWKSLEKEGATSIWVNLAGDYVKAATTTRSLADSLRTLMNIGGNWDFYQENGYLLQEHFDAKVTSVGGYYKTIANMLGGGLPANRKAFADYMNAERIDSGPFSEFREILQYATQEGITLHLFISPMHAAKLEYLAQLGLKKAYDSWRQHLVSIVDESNLTGGHWKLWDFSGYNTVTTEPIPASGDLQQNMAFFLDATHYKHVVGDVILDKVIDNRSFKGTVFEQFGTLINVYNIESHLVHENQQRLVFFERSPVQRQIYHAMFTAKGLKGLWDNGRWLTQMSAQ